MSATRKEPDRPALQNLRERVRAIEGRAAQERQLRRARLGLEDSLDDACPTGWATVDQGALGGAGLPRGRLHEWCGVTGLDQGSGSPWAPALTLLTHLAWKGTGLKRPLKGSKATPNNLQKTIKPDPREGHALWIGRAVWPRLSGGEELLERSLFIDPPDRSRRLWAIDAALRCPAVAVVVADGSGLSIEESRRLQLAAESGRALALLARPAEERRELSVATTRWSVVRTPNDESDRPRWKVALLRLKGAGSTSPTPVVDASFGSETLLGRWALEWNVAKSLVVELPPLVHRSRPAAPAPRANLGSA